MKTKQLPQEWKEVQLGEVLDYEQPTNYIVSNDKYSDEYETPVLTAGKSFILGYTNEKEGVYNKLPVIIFDDFTTSSKFVTFQFKVKSSAMKLLTPKTKDVDLKFIFLLMQTLKFDYTTHKRYYLSKYQYLKIPLPSLQTQKAIVSILEKAEQLKEKRKQTIEYLDDYLKSVFYEMFLKKKFEIKNIEEVASKEKNSIKAGPFGSSLKKEFYTDGGYKIYGQEQVIRDDLSYGDYYIDENRYRKLESCKIKEGDILISLVGSFGYISIVPKDFEPGIINPRLMKITLDKKKVNPIFFKKLLLSNKVKQQIKDSSHGGTMDIVNVGIIKKIKIPLPPIELQQKFALIVEHVEKLREKQKTSLVEIEQLSNVLIQKAFLGELV